MNILDFSPKNLLNIKEPTELTKLNKQQVYELQVLLDYLDYELALDGVLGSKTINIFKEFKKDSFQTDPHLIGPGSISILLKLLDKEKDEIEKEDVDKSLEVDLTNNKSIPKSIYDITWNDFDAPVSRYFTVGEVTRRESRRVPPNDKIKNNVFNLAKKLDKVREVWGSPIGVTSWYRPPAVNRSVGGARFSQHLQGNAVDIYPMNGKGLEFEKWLDQNWYGRLGKGQRKRRGFSHCDIQNGKGLQAGGTKGIRWDY